MLYMFNQEHIFIALIAALINLILSIIVPCALGDNNNNKDGFLSQIRKMLEHHRATLFSSSVLVAFIVYLSLEAAPHIRNEFRPNSVLNLALLPNAPVRLN